MLYSAIVQRDETVLNQIFEATKDGAYQLTLKVFKREGLDVKETLTREAFDLINNVEF